ncbi:GM10520 [Drosophila sechellia]|uniref:GM10520 n=1 Tax=Drosophila sechellia TaxID=7238 RepID=B4I4L4_DROSE|nr:GM10520 [Drosophila sechellia]
MSIPSPGQHPNIQHPAFRPSSRRPAACQISPAKSRVPILGQYQDQQIDRQMFASASSQAAKVLEDHRAEEMGPPWARQMEL